MCIIRLSRFLCLFLVDCVILYYEIEQRFRKELTILYNGISEKYVAYIAPHSGAVDRDFNKLSLGTENGFLWDADPESNEALREDGIPKDNTSEVGIPDDALNT